MTVSAKVRKSLPPSRMGKPGSDEYPMPDKRHAAIAKGFAAMHHDPDKAAIDAKANKILARKRGGFIGGGFKKTHLGRPGRSLGGQATAIDEPTDIGRMMENEDASGKDRWTGTNYPPRSHRLGE